MTCVFAAVPFSHLPSLYAFIILSLCLPQQSQSSVWMTWKRTTTTQFLWCQCLVPLVPPHSHHAPAAHALRSAARQAPCCRTVWRRTAGTMDPGPPTPVQEKHWLGATPALLFCPHLPWIKLPWMKALDLSPAPPSLVMPYSGRVTLLHPTPHHQW